MTVNIVKDGRAYLESSDAITQMQMVYMAIMQREVTDRNLCANRLEGIHMC